MKASCFSVPPSSSLGQRPPHGLPRGRGAIIGSSGQGPGDMVAAGFACRRLNSLAPPGRHPLEPQEMREWWVGLIRDAQHTQ
jgi:hypothetical protein